MSACLNHLTADIMDRSTIQKDICICTQIVKGGSVHDLRTNSCESPRDLHNVRNAPCDLLMDILDFKS